MSHASPTLVGKVTTSCLHSTALPVEGHIKGQNIWYGELCSFY